MAMRSSSVIQIASSHLAGAHGVNEGILVVIRNARGIGRDVGLVTVGRGSFELEASAESEAQVAHAFVLRSVTLLAGRKPNELFAALCRG